MPERVIDIILQLLIKRLMDIIIAILTLIALAPLIFISLIFVLISDGFPLFYSFYVIGLNEKEIRVTKIRTMIKDADEVKEKLLHLNEMKGPAFKITDDPRIVKFCSWIRKTSLDETPQLLSVIKGDLSLVGPRASRTEEFAQFKEWHKRKVTVKPGLTCLWQISGRNKISDFDDWSKLDLEYIDNWSIFLDIKILFLTIPEVLFAKGK